MTSSSPTCRTSANSVRDCFSYCYWGYDRSCDSVYYNDIPVGTMCCRIEVAEGKAKLYLMTMAVLAVRPRPSTIAVRPYTLL